jgi:2'-5' RNA ligase
MIKFLIKFQSHHLSPVTASQFKTPPFVPHVTLLAGFEEPVEEVIAKTKMIATTLRPYRFKVERIAVKPLFFQCIYALMEKSEDVMHANSIARKFLGREHEPSYMPHLSLVYGNHLTEEEKKIIASDIEDEVVGIEFEVSSVAVWSTQVRVQRVSLQRTQDPYLVIIMILMIYVK